MNRSNGVRRGSEAESDHRGATEAVGSMDKARGDESSRLLAIISTRDHTRLGKRVSGLSGVQMVRSRPFSLRTTGLGKEKRR